MLKLMFSFIFKERIHYIAHFVEIGWALQK